MRAGALGMPLFFLPSRGERFFHLAGSGDEQPGSHGDSRLLQPGSLQRELQRVGHVLGPHGRTELPGDDVAREVARRAVFPGPLLMNPGHPECAPERKCERGPGCFLINFLISDLREVRA